MTDFEVTAEGLETPRLPEVRALVVDQWHAAFGDNAQTASDSTDGLEIDVISIINSLLWEAGSEVYNDSFLRTSSGGAVDLILDMFGRKRLAAQASTASAVWYGNDAVAISAGSLASVADVSDSRFGTDVLATTGTDDLVFVVRIKNALDGETYTITINGTDEDFVAGPADTVLTIAADLANQITSGPSPATGSAIAIVDANGFGLVVIDGTAALTVSTSATGLGDLDDRFGVRVAMTATATGATSALSGTLSVIETPIGGVDGVINSTDAVVGRNRETDAEYKQRHFLTINASGCGTVQAIEARVLLVEDVESVTVFENDSDVVDGDGRPPHSFETFAVGGDDTAIAEAILACKPAGIQTVGDISIVLPSTSKPIKFSRPTNRYLHLDVTITQGEGFPTTGEPAIAIRDALAAWLGSGGPGELKQGLDLHRDQLYQPITTAVPGIATIAIETDDTPNPGDVPVFTAADIIVTDDEILISDSSRIAVTIL